MRIGEVRHNSVFVIEVSACKKIMNVLCDYEIYIIRTKVFRHCRRRRESAFILYIGLELICHHWFHPRFSFNPAATLHTLSLRSLYTYI